MEFPAKLKLLIERNRYSQATVAKSFGISANLISLWVRGKSVPDLYQARRIADFFGVTVDFLSDNAADEPPVDADRASDERLILDLYHALGITKTEALRALARASTSNQKQPPSVEETEGETK
ncbi:MAG: helix-turn-helix transcriptional regulator [Isosphaeraceae bacterium]|nr:helix-turn-helix transcriptional regulator [Isosphaeraceae bacterium]